MNQQEGKEPDSPEGSPMLVMKAFAVGDGGVNLAQSMAQLTGERELILINTDPKALCKVRGAEKLCVGVRKTRGLGVGGDPELARVAAEEELESLRQLCSGTDLALLLTCLGGGTGSGISPVLARVAKETGAKVLAIVTLPFHCEGARRRNQAQAALQRLRAAADGVILLSNEKMMKHFPQNSSVLDAYRLANEMAADAVRCFTQLLTNPGLIKVSFSDFCAVLRGRCVESTFVQVEASSENVAKLAFEAMLAHPAMETGQTLFRADGILLSLASGPDLTMAQVDWITSQFQARSERAQIALGTTLREDYRNRLGISVLVCERDQSIASDPTRESNASEEGHGASFTADSLLDAGELRTPRSRSASRFIPPTTPLTPERREQILAHHKRPPMRSSGRGPRTSQGQLPLEIVPKGRFDKSEPTIHEGEDLDIPTYIRRGVPLN